MKQFDPASINQRLLKTLSNLSGWTQMITDSGVTSTTNSFSEMEAEAVRYQEYLLFEAKWGKAQNLSSLLSQAPFLGYLPHRKISAINTDGFVVSHDARLQSAGVTNIFSLSDLTTTNLSVYTGAPFTIPERTIFTSTGSVQFISTQDVPYPNTLATTYDGRLYTIIPIVQGIWRSVNVTVLGNPYETISLSNNDASGITQIESATNIYSSQFFTVSVTASGSNTAIVYNQVEDIFLAASTDPSYDISVASDYSSVSVRFGNGVTGLQLTPNAVVTISYLETLGSLGEVNQNFSITSLASVFPVPLYCTNFTSALGGKDVETIESIRGSAPSAYLLSGGSIITTAGYTKAIETIPYVHLATVYSGTYNDPISGPQSSILYSAIKTDGTAPDITQFNIDVMNVLAGKTNPLDAAFPIDPGFLHLKFNVLAKIASTNANLPALISEINSALYTKYGTLSQTFATPIENTAPQQFRGLFDNSELTTFVKSSYGLTNVTNQVEAVVDLKPSTFVSDGTLVNYFDAPFSFDPSFVRMRGFEDGALHALKINIFFNCPECQFNGISFSRTLFVIQQPNITSAYTVSFTFLTSSIVAGNIIVSGYTVPLLAADIVSPTTVALKINTYFNTTLPQVLTPGASTILMNGPIPSVFPSTGVVTFLHGTTPLVFSYTSITGGNTFAGCSPAPNGTTLAASDPFYFPYTVALNSSNPGVLTITPTSSSVAPPTINMGTTGITVTATPSVRWGDGFTYSVPIQYPYIPNITDYGFMKNFALKSGMSPSPILPSDTTTPYIPFVLIFDYTSLNPVNLTASSLCTGTLKIPQYLPDNSGNYINFLGNLGSIIDGKITIQVIAQPFSPDIVPAAKNNIIEISPAPGTVAGQQNLTPDITTQVTYA